MANLRTLQVKPESKDRFLELGTMKDTHDSLLVKLMSFYDKYHEYEPEIKTMIRTNEIMNGD